MDNKKRHRNGRWRKGFCPNPRGRPRKGVSLTDLLRAGLAKHAGPDGPTRAEAVADAIIDAAVKGDLRAAVILMERLEGPPVKQVDMAQRLREYAAAHNIDPDELLREAETVIAEISD